MDLTGMNSIKREPTGAASFEERIELISPATKTQNLVEEIEESKKSSIPSNYGKVKPDNVQLEMDEELCVKFQQALEVHKHICEDECHQKFPLHYLAFLSKYKKFEKELNNPLGNLNLMEKDCHQNTILLHLCTPYDTVIQMKEAEENEDPTEAEYSDDEESSGDVAKFIQTYLPTFCHWPVKDVIDSSKPKGTKKVENSEKAVKPEHIKDLIELEELDVSETNTMHSLVELLMKKIAEKGVSKKEIKQFVNSKNAEGNTALHHAAADQLVELVELLLKNGADASSQNIYGDTPLHLLRERRSADAHECTKLLLDTMSNKDILNKHNYSVLAMAMSNFSMASAETIQLMLNKGCSVAPMECFTENGKEGQRPISILHEAFLRETSTDPESFKSFKVFVDALSEEDINRKNDSGCTVLHLAAHYLEVHFLTHLLNHEKINLYIKDKNGDAAFHLIAIRGWNKGSAECVELLMNKASSDFEKTRLFHHKNDKNMTALEISVQKDSVPLAEAILMSRPQASSVLHWMKPKLFRRIYEKVPEIFLPVLNQFINYEQKNYEANAETFSAQIVVLSGHCHCHLHENNGTPENNVINGTNQIQEPENKLDKANSGNNKIPKLVHRETDYLAKLLESQYVEKDEMEKFLSHPIVSLFILEKWKKLRGVYWSGMLCKMLWLIAYISFAIDIFWISFPYKTDSTDNNGNDANILEESLKQSKNDNHADYLDFRQTSYGIFLVATNVILFVFKTMLSYNAVGFQKSLRPTFFIHSLFTFFIGFILISVFCEGVQDWHHVAIAISVIWIGFICVWDTRDFPVFGKYADVFFIVMKNFLRFVISFLPLFGGFSIALGLMLRMNKSFQELHWNIIKIFVMMLGEINFDEIFGGDDVIPFRSFAILTVGLFVITVPIVLLNLLLGFTVSDVQALKSEGEIKVRISTLEHIIVLERFVLSPFLQKIFPKRFFMRFIMELQEDKGTKWDICIKMIDIPREIRQRIREIARLHQMTKTKN